MKKNVICLILTWLWSCIALSDQQPGNIIAYKAVDGHELKLHVFNPPGHQPSDSKPAVVFFFGGGWVGGQPAHFYRQSAYFASRGMVAISAEYRIKKIHNTSPKEALIDGKSAIRWVRGNAQALGIDPTKIVAGGGSAGGHIAAATATSKGFNAPDEDVTISARPNALMLFNPVLDTGPDGYGYGRVKGYWRDFSPLHNLDANTPPTIIFLGTEDKIIPVAVAESYQRKMNENKTRCDLLLYANEPHGFFNNSKYAETLSEADRFLVSLGYLGAKPKQ